MRSRLFLTAALATLVASSSRCLSLGRELIPRRRRSQDRGRRSGAARPARGVRRHELVKHVERVTGQAPQTTRGGSVKAGNRNLIGRPEGSPAIHRLAREGFFQLGRAEQGYSLRIDRNPHDQQGGSWLAVICGADPQGVLYGVRDFSHYHFYKEDSRVVLRPARVELAPRLKLQGPLRIGLQPVLGRE